MIISSHVGRLATIQWKRIRLKRRQVNETGKRKGDNRRCYFWTSDYACTSSTA